MYWLCDGYQKEGHSAVSRAFLKIGFLKKKTHGIEELIIDSPPRMNW
jgi:hypothetical protein